MFGLKGKLRRLYEQVVALNGVHHADLDEPDLGRIQELIHRGLVNEHRTPEGRVYKMARATSRPDLRGGVSTPR